MRHNKLCKALAITLASMMMLTACGEVPKESSSSSESKISESSASKSTASESSASKSSAAESTASESAERTETIELTVYMKEYDGLDYETNWETLAIEEALNVDLKFITFPTTEAIGTQFNLLAVSGEEAWPDIIFGGNFNTDMVNTGIDAKMLLPLDDYIVDGTNYKRALDENPTFRANLTATDGHIYTAFYHSMAYHTKSKDKIFIYTDWLKKLGWEKAPSTPEEFKEFLIQVRDTDVNGNGDKTDEIPLVGYNAQHGNPLHTLMNPFQLVTKGKYYHITDDGKLEFEANTDGWRKGLTYIADLYAEGLIAEETYIQDNKTMKGLINKPASEMLVASVADWWTGSFVDKQNLTWWDFEPLAPLKGDFQQISGEEYAFNLSGAITTTCEHPDVAFEVIDYILDYNGIEGKTYEMSNEPSVMGTTPSLKAINTEEKNTKYSAGSVPGWDSAEKRYGVTDDPETYYTKNTKVLYEHAAVYEDYYVYANIPKVIWADSDTQASYSDYSSLITEYIGVAATEFIMGIRDINDDKQWEAYLKDLEDMGLTKYLELLEKYYRLK